MAFKLDQMKGYHSDKNTINLGTGLLNDASKDKAIEKMDIEYLSIDSILPNPNNKLSMDEIEELAQQIEMASLVQPLEVRKIDNDPEHWMLLTGHRRLEAIKLLRSRQKWKSDFVPCTIRDLSKMNVPLNDDLKEMFAILTTNQQRNKTDADLIFEYQWWHKIYLNLRKAGVKDFLLGEDDKGHEVVQHIEGVSTRELISESINTSPSQVGKIERVIKKGSTELLKAIEDNNISLSSAEEVSRLPKEEQADFINTLLEKRPEQKINTRDLNAYLKNKEKSSPKEASKTEVSLTLKDFKKDIQEVQDILKNGEISLDSKQHKDYTNALRRLYKILSSAKNDLK